MDPSLPRRDDAGAAGPEFAKANLSAPLTIFDHLAIIWKRKTLLLGPIVVFGVLGVLYTATRKPQFQGAAMLVTQTKPEGGGVIGGAGDPLSQLQAATQLTDADTQVAVLSSASLIRKAFESLPEGERVRGFGAPAAGGPPNAPPEAAVKVDSTRETDIITISVKALDPQAAADLASAIGRQYLRDGQEREVAEARRARLLVEQQLRNTEDQFVDATGRLADFEHQAGFVDPDSQLKALSDSIASTKTSIDNSDAALAAAWRSSKIARGLLGGEAPQVASSTTTAQNPGYASAEAELVQLQTQLASLRQEYAPDSKSIKEQEAKIASLQELLRTIKPNYTFQSISSRNPVSEELQKDLVTSTEQASSYRASLAVQKASLKDQLEALSHFPDDLKKYTILKQKVNTTKASLDALAQKQAELLSAETSVLPSGYIVPSVAQAGARPVSPNHLVNLAIALFAGLVFGVTIVFFAERIDPHVSAIGQIEREFGLEVLSVVPYSKPKTASRVILQDADNKSRAVSEAFRYLRNGVLLATEQGKPLILCITSPGPGEGKTTIAVGLADALGRDGRVLVIDANLRAPALHRLIGRTNDRGLTTLSGDADDVPQTVARDVFPNVDVLTSGPNLEGNSEALGSLAATGFFEKLAVNYDVVLLDGPSCASESDTQILGRLSNGVIIVVSPGQTLAAELKVSLRLLRQARATILGCVANRAEDGGRRPDV